MSLELAQNHLVEPFKMPKLSSNYLFSKGSESAWKNLTFHFLSLFKPNTFPTHLLLCWHIAWNSLEQNGTLESISHLWKFVSLQIHLSGYTSLHKFIFLWILSGFTSLQFIFRSVRLPSLCHRTLPTTCSFQAGRRSAELVWCDMRIARCANQQHGPAEGELPLCNLSGVNDAFL